MTYTDDAAKRAALVILTEAEIPKEFRSEVMYALPHDSPEQKANLAAFQAWLRETKTYYYARPRTCFYKYEAEELAIQHHCTRLLLEGMS